MSETTMSETRNDGASGGETRDRLIEGATGAWEIVLGLEGKISGWSGFDRKNYLSPDLPQGYQISQYKDPIVGEGEIEVERDDGSVFTVRIERLHLEQDAGKSIHDLDPNFTMIDLN